MNPEAFVVVETRLFLKSDAKILLFCEPANKMNDFIEKKFDFVQFPTK